MSDIFLLQVVTVVCITTAFVASLRFLRRYIELRHERPRHAIADDLSERIQRIEATVETTALEVERIAESNRFVAKLLAERVPVPGASSRPERVITPH